MDTMGMDSGTTNSTEVSSEISTEGTSTNSSANSNAIIAPNLLATQAPTLATSSALVASTEASALDRYVVELADSNGDLSCDSIFAYSPDSELAPGASVEQPVTYVTQSRFFTPLFNAAIFDGPIRIYFAQHQEPQAMKLYISLQERYGDLRQQARDVFRERGANIFVMLYPDATTFEKSFGFDFDEDRVDVISMGSAGAGAEAGAKLSPSAMPQIATGGPIAQTIHTDRMGADYVVGVRGPVMDESFDALCGQIEKIIRHA